MTALLAAIIIKVATYQDQARVTRADQKRDELEPYPKMIKTIER